MTTDYMFTNVNDALRGMCTDLMTYGAEVGSRLGERVKEETLVSIELGSPADRYVTTEGRNASLPAQIAETMWVLSGRDDVAWLRNYLPRAADFSDDGERWRGAYGPRLRNWNGVDQLRHVVELLQGDALSRRAVMSIYDPARDTEPGKDIPCNNWISFISREGMLHMHVAIRSNDLLWGWSGINQFEWSTIQEIVANLLGVQVGALKFSITSLHIYDRHWEKARRIGQARYRHPNTTPPPRFQMPEEDGLGRNVESLDKLIKGWFHIESLCRAGEFGSADYLISAFPEPMLRSWLRVIRAFWTPDTSTTYLVERMAPSALTFAYEQSPKRTWEAQPVPELPTETAEHHDFWTTAAILHEQKHVAYGDSWKRRGEVLGIQANIARKVDRISGGETPDETSADTAMDLLIYLIKYRLWLSDTTRLSAPMCVGQYADPLSDLSAPVTEYLMGLRECRVGKGEPHELAMTKQIITEEFEQLTSLPEDGNVLEKAEVISRMIALSHELAVHLWSKEQSK